MFEFDSIYSVKNFFKKEYNLFSTFLLYLVTLTDVSVLSLNLEFNTFKIVDKLFFLFSEWEWLKM